MTRNIPSSCLEIEIETDVIRKYLGMPIIFRYVQDFKEENDCDYVTSGILTGVEDNEIYLEKVSVLSPDGDEPPTVIALGEGGQWVEWGEDFTKDGEPNMPLDHIQFMCVSKEGATLKQMQEQANKPEESTMSLEKIMCIYCWNTFPEEKLKKHQSICEDFDTIGCPKCYDGIGMYGTKNEKKKALDEHLTWCDDPFRTEKDVQREIEETKKIIEKYGSMDNFHKHQDKETKANSDSVKKQADLWKRIKAKN